MNRTAWPVAAVVLGATLVLIGWRREPGGDARGQGQPAGEQKERIPGDVRIGAKLVFDLPKHPFGGEGFEGPPVVEVIRGSWVRLRQKVKKDFEEKLNQKEARVWVNFDTVNWYWVLP
jgi:hypothetical protein